MQNPHEAKYFRRKENGGKEDFSFDSTAGRAFWFHRGVLRFVERVEILNRNKKRGGRVDPLKADTGEKPLASGTHDRRLYIILF